jgi:molybdate transport repressor ModE-like protein
MLDVNRLRVLREVARRGTLTAAAKALWITPPSVSHHIAALEHETGVKLLERVGRRVRLTPAAERLVKNSDEVFAAMERAEADLASSLDEVVGAVTVASFMSAMRPLVIPAAAAVSAKYPALDVRIEDIDQPESIDELLGGKVDISLGLEWTLDTAPTRPDLDRELLVSEPVFLALPSTHPRANGPVDVADLSGDRWIAPVDDPCRRAILHSAAFGGFEPKLASVSSCHYEVIAAAVGAGFGVSILPAFALEGCASPDVVFHALADVPLRRLVFAAMRPGSRLNPAISAMLSALRERAAEVAAAFPK